MTEITLTPTSYIVLGLIAWGGECTPYDLKGMVAVSVGNFWSVPHSQLYAEPERLAKAGYLDEQREQGGRRRRLYSLTKEGRKAFADWQQSPAEGAVELRDPGSLKLFFGGEVTTLAASELKRRRAKLAEYEQVKASFGPEVPEGPRMALEIGIGVEKGLIRAWEGLAKKAG